MTLLSVCQNVADEVQIHRPATIISNTDVAAQKLLRLCTRMALYLNNRATWPVQRRERTFSATATEEQTNILPADFLRFIPETFWNRSTTVLISGPISPVQWQSLKATTYIGDYQRFMQRGKSIFILPAPGNADSLAFEYVTKYFVDTDDDGLADADEFSDDTDTFPIDEELLTLAVTYAYLDSEQQPGAQTALVNFRRYFSDLLDNTKAESGILSSGDIFGGGRHFTGAPADNRTGGIW